jgi:magnesium-transporting ATPase (P-type)
MIQLVSSGQHEVSLTPVQLMHCISPSLYCNDSSISSEDCTPQAKVSTEGEEGKYEVIGEPTESSITSLAINIYGLQAIQAICQNLSIEESPFDSAVKFMATMHDLSWEEYAAAVEETCEISEEMVKGNCPVYSNSIGYHT